MRVVQSIALRTSALLVLLAGIGCGDDDSKPEAPQQQAVPLYDAGSGGHSATNTSMDGGFVDSCTPGSKSTPFTDNDPCPQNDPKCPAAMYEALAMCGLDGSWEKTADGAIMCACYPKNTSVVMGTGGVMAGTGGVSSPPIKPSFSAHMEDSDVILETTGQAFFDAGCANPLGIEKRDGKGWTPLRDDRPKPVNGHIDDYFLDGQYVAAFDFNCDVPQCSGIGAKLRAGYAIEFVKTGTQPRPDDRGLPAATLVVIESREYSGEIAVSLTWAETSRCNPTETTIIPVTAASSDDAGT